MSEMVRIAIKRLREEQEKNKPPFERLLQQTSGIWKNGDGLRYQEKLRGEWS
jgi:hypothetical protein